MSDEPEEDQPSTYVSPDTLVTAWRALGSRIAVIAGSATALISLIGDTPVRVASLRGGIVWGLVSTCTSVGAWLALRTWAAPAVDPEEDLEAAEVAEA